MNYKTGSKETALVSVIFSLSSLFPAVLAKNTYLMGGGSLINFLLCFSLVLLFILPLKMVYQSFGSIGFQEIVTSSLGRVFNFMITPAICVLILFASSFCLNYYSDALSHLCTDKISRPVIGYAILAAAFFCAYLGVESVTRQGYVLFYLAIFFLVLIIISCIKGARVDNLYPVLGYEKKEIFQNISPLCLCAGLGPFLMISDCVRTDKSIYLCIRRFIFLAFCIAFFVILVYTLTVPYPMSAFFTLSHEAVFASTSSGELLHRFDLFLTSLYVVICVVSVSYALVSVAHALCILTGMDEPGGYIMLCFVALFAISHYEINAGMYIKICLALAVLPVGTALLSLARRKLGR